MRSAISASGCQKADLLPLTSRPTSHAPDAAGAARDLGATHIATNIPTLVSLSNPPAAQVMLALGGYTRHLTRREKQEAQRMSVKEIEIAITQLSAPDLAELMAWLENYHAQM